MSIDAIKQACLKHFEPQIGSGMICDVLAGEQGPSCTHKKQIPNLKLIHVRFIYDDERNESDCVVVRPEKPRKRKISPSRVRPSSMPSPKKTKALEPKTIPKNLSIASIMKLGKVIETTSKLVNIHTFDLHAMSWTTIPTPVDFVISTEVFGEGDFRTANMATSTTKGFASNKWVVKRYNDQALQEIRITNQTVENHTKKVVKMHNLAKNFALRMESEVTKKSVEEKFGKVMNDNNIYLGKLPCGEVVTIEEYVQGEMTKYINNDGIPCPGNPVILQEKAECLVHFSFEDSNHEVMLIDLQGVEYSLFDPEIASTTITDDVDNEFMFTTGNLSKRAIDNFSNKHSCNSYCKYIGLKPLNP